ncbi:hypothetical protein MHBO_002672 [Bonamia ostreae]|uniref:Acyltransferase 3 domain-containing protein n=1 Tax=Bonamia ostreae TaxID=126728 RepID=A0ABV2AN41_9EUKA
MAYSLMNAKFKSGNFEDIKTNKTKKRDLTIDFIRCVSVFLIIFVHITITTREIQHPRLEEREVFIGILYVYLQFGIPMLFYISGRSAAMSRKSEDGFKTVLTKSVKLILPVFPAHFLIVIPTGYLSSAYSRAICGNLHERNFFRFYWSYILDWVEHPFKCGFWWLWFLVVLWIVSIFSLPGLMALYGETINKKTVGCCYAALFVSLIIVSIFLKNWLLLFNSAYFGILICFPLLSPSVNLGNRIITKSKMFIPCIYGFASSILYVIVTSVLINQFYENVKQIYSILTFVHYTFFYSQTSKE